MTIHQTVPRKVVILVLFFSGLLAIGGLYLYWEAGDYEYKQYMNAATETHVVHYVPAPVKEIEVPPAVEAPRLPETEEAQNNEPPLSSTKILQHTVPFAAQAPFGDWNDPRQQDGCEEMSMIMAMHWIQETPLTKTQALKELVDLVAWEEETYGYSEDTSATTTALTLQTYYKHASAKTVENPEVEDILEALNQNSVVLAPMNGIALRNPYFNPPGPDRHMLVITGYDMDTQEFITNDPGTRRGEGFRYSFSRVMHALRDYPSGKHVPFGELRKTVIIVEKN